MSGGVAVQPAVAKGAPLVFDLGSANLRVGSAGFTSPTLVLPSLVGYPKGRAHVGMDARDIYVGKDAASRRAVCQLVSPVVGSSVQDWKALGTLLSHAYDRLGVSAEAQPVIVTESPAWSHSDRLELGKLLFGTLRVPSVWIATQGVMGLFATGATSGIVLDSGDGSSHVQAVLNGVSLPSCKVRSGVAGAVVGEHLARLLTRRGIQARDYARDLKEALSHVALDFDEEIAGSVSHPSRFTQDYRTPDGAVVTVGAEAFEAPEVCFTMRPNMSQRDLDLPSALGLCAMAVEEPERAALLGHIVAVGGNTCLNGFRPRMELELNNREMLSRYHQTMTLRVKSPESPMDANWVGASILGALPSTRLLYTTVDDVKEQGMAALCRHSLGDFVVR